jgi:hypothetical protein
MIIRFEFHGGCKDGDSVLGTDDIDDLSNPARAYLHLTMGGRAGVRFSEYPSQADLQRATKEFVHQRDWLPAKFRALPECELKAIVGRLPWTYEVTKREEGPDRVLIRLDAVGSVFGK